MSELFTMQSVAANPSYLTVLLTLLIAFLMSTVLAVTYVKTFRGLTYSRNYIQALVLGSMVAAIVMQAIGDSLARGLGMIGALAIIRFRTNFKDPRDIIFIFASMAIGIACGVYGYAVAIVGTIMFCLVAVILYFLPFQQDNLYDGILRFTSKATVPNKGDLENHLRTYCRIFALISIREFGDVFDYAYQIKLKNPQNKSVLIEKLKTIESIGNVNLLLQETTVEL